MQEYLVSIVVPIYNSATFLSRCIESVINQSYKRIEIILVDDGSTDNSLDICNSYKLSDERISIIHQQNAGVSSARNKGIKECHGDWIYFVDSDDWINKDAIYSLVSGVMDSRCLYLHQANIVDTDDYTCRSFWPYKYDDCLIEIDSVNKNKEIFDKVLIYGTPWGKLYHVNTIKKHNIYFDESISFHEDHCFYLKYISLIDRIKIISSTGYYYWRNNRELSLSQNRKSHNPIKVIYSANIMDKYIDIILQRIKGQNFDVLKSFVLDVRLSALRNAIRLGWSYVDTLEIYKDINAKTIYSNYRPNSYVGKLLKFVFMIPNFRFQYYILKLINKATNRL